MFGVPTLLVTTAITVGNIIDNKVVSFWFFILSYVLVGFVLLPLFANQLYYRFVKKKISRARARARNVAEGEQLIALYRAGGTSGAALFGFVPFVFVILAVGSAALVIPAERDYATRAQMSEGINIAGGPRAAVLEYFEEHGELPASNEQAGISPPNEISSHYVSQVSIEDGQVVILYGNRVNARLFGKEVVLIPDVSKFPDVSWKCSARDIPNKLLVSMCRSN
jgi:type IV pilus assembly protein PilA